MANQGQNVGSFVPTNYIWEISQLEDMNVTSPQFKDLLVRLYQNLNLMQISLNLKDAGYYNTNEFVNGQKFFPSSGSNQFRQVYRLTVNFGALPNATTKSVAHGLTITSGYSFTRIYATASDTTNKTYMPIPNANADVNMTVDATNVNIKTSTNLSSYNMTYVVLEYLKQ